MKTSNSTAAAAGLLLLLLMLLLAAPSSIHGAKILLVVPMAGPSQYHLLMTLAYGLANHRDHNGHHHKIDVITCTPGKSTHPNVTVHANAVPSITPEMVKEYMKKSMKKSDAVFSVYNIMEYLPPMVDDFFSRDDVKRLLMAATAAGADGRKKSKYDLAIVDHVMNEWTAAVIASVAPVVMYASTGTPMMWSNSAPIPPSFVPNYYEPMPSRMNFRQRLRNAIVYAANRLTYNYILLPYQQRLLSAQLPKGAPTIEETEKKVHFILSNQDPVMYSPRPSMPNVVDAGGWQCRDGKPLPKDLEDFVQKSGENGFIVFGLGTNVKSEYLDPKIIQAFLSAFSRLKQNVVWKFEAKLDNLPPNVKIIDWMPQQDMLAHPKIRLFMTHGGLMSLQESAYHGVPVIGFPIFFDQYGNVARIVELGMGEMLDLPGVTEEGVYQTITKVLNDRKYAENAKKYSRIFRDQPQHPLERAIFWVEYVIRHKGAFHLRSPAADLNFFQYFLLDVIAFLAVVVAVAVLVVAFAVRFLLRRIFGGGNNNTSKINSDEHKKLN